MGAGLVFRASHPRSVEGGFAKSVAAILKPQTWNRVGLRTKPPRVRKCPLLPSTTAKNSRTGLWQGASARACPAQSCAARATRFSRFAPQDAARRHSGAKGFGITSIAPRTRATFTKTPLPIAGQDSSSEIEFVTMSGRDHPRIVEKMASGCSRLIDVEAIA
jgi:hypothetical protein